MTVELILEDDTGCGYWRRTMPKDLKDLSVKVSRQDTRLRQCPHPHRCINIFVNLLNEPGFAIRKQEMLQLVQNV